MSTPIILLFRTVSSIHMRTTISTWNLSTSEAETSFVDGSGFLLLAPCYPSWGETNVVHPWWYLTSSLGSPLDDELPRCSSTFIVLFFHCFFFKLLWEGLRILALRLLCCHRTVLWLLRSLCSLYFRPRHSRIFDAGVDNTRGSFFSLYLALENVRWEYSPWYDGGSVSIVAFFFVLLMMAWCGNCEGN